MSYDIREIYQTAFCIGDINYPMKISGSTESQFFYRFEIPKGFSGKIQIQAFDFVGNKDTATLFVQ